MVCRKSKIVCIGFQSTNNHLNTNTILTGNPVRRGISNGIRSNAKSSFNLDPDKKPFFYLEVVKDLPI